MSPRDPRKPARMAAGRHAGEGQCRHIAPGLRALAVPISKLIPDPANARTHSDRNVETIKASLLRYGQRKPVVVNRRTGEVEAGNATVAAALALGWGEIAAVYVDDDPKTAAGYSVADNRTAELAEWDDGALARTLAFLRDEHQLEHVGFDDADLDRLLRSLRPAKEETFNVAEALRAAPELAERVQRVQVWQLGKHRLMCGDSTHGEDVRTLMGGELADMLFTSPPYNVGVAYESHDDDTVPWDEYGRFLREALTAWLPQVEAGRIIAWNIGVSPKTYHARQHVLLEEMGLTFVRQMVWKKVGVPLPMWHNTVARPVARHFTPNYVHEIVLLFSKGPVETGQAIHLHPLCENDVFEIHQTTATTDIPRGNQRTGVKSNLDRRSFKAHPAVYPTMLPEMFITHLADREAIVADPFLGAGSTIVAAANAGRICYGMEVDPTYCAVAIARWESYTGESATLLEEVDA